MQAIIPWVEIFWSAGKALLITLVLTPIIRDIFRSYNVVDQPNHRKVHVHPIPRVGGIAIAIGYTTALFTQSGLDIEVLREGSVAWKLLPGTIVIFLTGMIDDFYTLRPLVKLSGEIVAAGLVFWSGVRVDTIADMPLPPWLSFPLTVFWVLLATNALNLIDGLDGLCTGMGLLATMTLFGAALLSGNMPLAFTTLPLAGALLGFLCYNFNPATVFLGDSGALLIGFLLGCYGMVWTQKAATILSITVPMLALSVPLLDVWLSVLRRFLRNKPVFSADRGHIHHRLLDRGLSPRRAVLVLYLAAASAAFFALILNSATQGGIRTLVVIAIIVVLWIGIRQLRYSEFRLASRLLFRGEFQHTLDVKLRLEQLTITLNQAATAEAWWDSLTVGVRDFGWTRICWKQPDRMAERVLATSTGACWRFEFPAGRQDWIEVEGKVVETRTPSVDLMAFASMVNENLTAKSGNWRLADTAAKQ